MKTKCRKIYNILFDCYGEVACPLDHTTPFQLMVAVMLSAQCTDKQVNKVTSKLFYQYPTPKLMSVATIEKIEELIKSTGLYRNKAKNILESAKKICSEYDCKVPEDIETLTKLPGIGRKSANAIVAEAFNKPGFAVDTHVIRLFNRIGIVETKIPEKIEFIVREILPLDLLRNFSLLLITHGRKCCKARKPNCPNCQINKLCNFWKT